MDIDKAFSISARGMDVQTTRLRVIAENLANQDTTGSTPGADPYRRKTVTFQNAFDRQLGTQAVQVKAVGRDQSELQLRYDPSNPAANAEGYVKLPNVNSLVGRAFLQCEPLCHAGHAQHADAHDRSAQMTAAGSRRPRRRIIHAFKFRLDEGRGNQ